MTCRSKRGLRERDDNSSRSWRQLESYPLVSIVTPSYNQGRYIEETILSIKNQDYPNIEHVIVDGGSTDNTLEILKKYEDTYTMRWISEPDKGQADAINKGFKLSAGEILGWQNADDTYNPGAISKAVAFFLKHPGIDLVFGNYCLIDDKNNTLQEFRLRPFNRKEYLYCFPNISNPSAFWKRELFFASSMLDIRLKYAMDFDFFMRASEHGKFRYVKYCFGNGRIQPSSKTSSRFIFPERDRAWEQENAVIRQRYGVKMDLDRPWDKQYRLWKIYFRTRRLFYYVVQGHWDYLFKKVSRHPLVQPWTSKLVSDGECRIGKKPRIAIIHPGWSLGGAGAVALWTLEALKKDYDLTLITTENVNFAELNAFFGSKLKSGEVEVRKIFNFRGSMLDGFLLKIALAQRYWKRHHKEFDLAIATRCEIDLGEPGIQYIHCPIWNDDVLRQLGQLPAGWQYRKGVPRRFYKLLCKYISKFNAIRMKQNITLVNSNWMGERVEETYGIKSRTVYPPVKEDFPQVPWEEREEGVVCLGTVSPGKHVEEIVTIIGQARLERPQVHLHIIGGCSDPAYAKRIRRLCEQNREWLFWEGKLPRERLTRLVAKHKYGIHGMPNEHFGIAVAEMVKAGCIPFVPNSGGQVEIVGDTRLLYADPKEAVDKILYVLQHEEIQTELRGHLHTQGQSFSATAFMKLIKEIVEQVLNIEKNGVV